MKNDQNIVHLIGNYYQFSTKFEFYFVKLMKFTQQY